MRRRLLLAVVACAVLLGAFAGCGSSGDDKSDTSGGAERIRAYMLLPVLPDGTYSRQEKGAREAAKSYPNLDLTIDAVTSRTDVAGMINKVQNAVTKDYDVIAVNSGGNGAQLAPALERAAQRGIKIVAFDQDAPHRDIYVQWDAEAAGAQAGEYMKRALPNGGKIGVLSAVAGNPLLDAITNSFLSTVRGSELDVAARLTTGGTVAGSRTKMENLLTSHPDLAGVFVDNDIFGSAGALLAMEASGKKPILVGMFGDPVAWKAIKAGTEAATVEMPFERFGADAVKYSVALGEGRTVPEQVTVPPVLVTQDNVDEIVREIEQGR